MIYQGTLDNGITLLCEPVDTTETVSVGFWYDNGSRDEVPAERGFSHFLEHMLFKGTRRRTALDIAMEIDRVGGAINAFTEKETTCYYCTLPADHLDLALDVLCDMITSSALDEAEITKEKVVVINEIKAAEDSPDEKGYQLFIDGLWGRHPLAAKIAGEANEVDRIDRAALQRFYHARYLPRQLMVSAAGAFDVDHVSAMIGERMAANGTTPAANQRAAPVRLRARDFIRDRYQQAQVYLGTTMEPTLDLRAYYALVVLSTAFGESMSSRLFQRIREDQGLCYSIGSFRSHYSDTWSWSIYANAMPELLPRLLPALNAELRRLRDEPLSDAEVADAISHITGSMVFAKEDMETRMKRLAGQQQMFKSVLEMDAAADVLRTITAADVAQVVETMVQPGQFNTLTYGTRHVGGLRRLPFDF